MKFPSSEIAGRVDNPLPASPVTAAMEMPEGRQAKKRAGGDGGRRSTININT